VKDLPGGDDDEWEEFEGDAEDTEMAA